MGEAPPGTTDGWRPEVYERFAAERAEPFHDLVGLLDPLAPGARVADLGCGTGELTATLVGRWRPREIVGIDRSPAMLARAATQACGPLRFEAGDIGRLDPALGAFDVILANASLQWVPDHVRVLASWRDRLRAGGRLAVQVPANADHPAHILAGQVASEPPFGGRLGDAVPPDPVAENVLSPEAYALALHGLGLVDVHVRLQVYLHVLPSTGSLVDWMLGTSLTRFREAFETEDFDRFVEAYRTRLLARLGAQEPYVYPFKRILLRATRPEGT